MLDVSAARRGLVSSALVAGLALSPTPSTEVSATHEMRIASATTYGQLYRIPGMDYWNPEKIASEGAEDVIA